jgi:hypothetical protein
LAYLHILNEMLGVESKRFYTIFLVLCFDQSHEVSVEFSTCSLMLTLNKFPMLEHFRFSELGVLYVSPDGLLFFFNINI